MFGDEVSDSPKHIEGESERPLINGSLVLLSQPPKAGEGYAVTTYMGDGNPLPSFGGILLFCLCKAIPKKRSELYWDALERITVFHLAVKEISSTGDASRILIRNKYARSIGLIRRD